MLTIKGQKEIILFADLFRAMNATIWQPDKTLNMSIRDDVYHVSPIIVKEVIFNKWKWIIRLEFVLVRIYFQVYVLCFVFLIIVGVLAVLCNTFVLFLFIRHKNVSVDTSLTSKCHSHLNQEFLSRVVNVPNIKYLENASCTEDAINRAIHSNYYRVLKV